MKKGYFLWLGLLLILSAPGCTKLNDKPCFRLAAYEYVNDGAGLHTIDKFSYKNGLLAKLDADYGQTFKIEYDAWNKLIGAAVYEGETQLYQISFMYKNGRVAEEVWRDVTTNELYDHVFLTYDSEGRMLRNESVMFDYYCVNTYYANGSLKSWHLFDHGVSAQMGEFTYERDYKNPYTSIKGISHCFWIANPAFGIRAGDRWYSSEKITVFDAGQAPSVLYEQDPAKTVWHMGEPPYPLQSDYVDKLTNGKILNIFSYENCNADNALESTATNRYIKPKHARQNKKNHLYF